jgi:hypothetical protein
LATDSLTGLQTGLTELGSLKTSYVAWELTP